MIIKFCNNFKKTGNNNHSTDERSTFRHILLVLLVTGLLLFCTAVSAESAQEIPDLADSGMNQSGSTPNQGQLISLDVPFIPNTGQQPDAVKFYADTFYGTAYVTDTDLTHAVAVTKNNETYGVALKEQFVTADGTLITLTPQGRNPAITKVSYFLGSDSGKWQSGLPTYNLVSLGTVWPGISAEVKAHGGNVEKFFTVAPGADPEDIRVKVLGARNIHVAENGNLAITTNNGDVSMAAPKGLQDGQSVTVAYRVLDDGTYGFTVGEYDQTKVLVIDPFLNYSTYLGGSTGDYGYAMTVDSSGNAYVAGASQSTTFPTTAGAYNTTISGGYDVFITKLNSEGTGLVYSTYLGGSAADYGYAIAVDSTGNAYIFGNTASSTNFPVTSGAYQTTYGGGSTDAFVSKLNADGTGLVYSTYLGGSTYDYGFDMEVDGSGNTYMTGGTNSADFPTSAGAYNTTIGGSYDAYITKLNADGTGLVYSTFVGGTNGEKSNAIQIDDAGNAYISGYTPSTDFPVTSGAYQTTYGGGLFDAFVTKITSDGTGLVYSTYLGGSLADGSSPTSPILDMVVDDSGYAYVTGYTSSTDFPVTSGAYQTTPGGNNDIFISKLNPDGTDLAYSTYLGGSDEDRGYALAVDNAGSAYVSGYTKSSIFPVTSGAYQTTSGGSYDAFVTKLNPDGTDVVYSTYLGGSSSDYGYALTIDNSGYGYIAGYTGSDNFPVTPEAYQTTRGGSNDAFVTKMDFRSPVAGFTSDVQSGEAPLTVTFTDESTGLATAWAWDFDNDGVTDATTRNATYSYTNPGTYTVNLTVSTILESSTESKTGYISVTTPQPPVAGFTADTTTGDVPFTVNFTDQSAGIVTAWAWDFDNDGLTDATTRNASWTYPSSGNYTVNLTVANAGGTNSSVMTDYITATQPQSATVSFTADITSGDAPLDVSFTDLTSGTISAWAWDFNNDGIVDNTTRNAKYTYTIPGNYSVNLSVTNAGGTSYELKPDYITVTTPIIPVANFSADTTSGPAPLSVNFTDQSAGIVTAWAWDFDNDGIIDATSQNPAHTYTSTGTYSVNLTVSNAGGTGYEVKSDYITVGAGSDLIVSAGPTSSLAPGPNLLAHYTANTVTVTVRNQGTQSAGAFNVTFNVDGNTTRVNVTGLAAGASTTVSMTDTVDRAVGVSVPVTATADVEDIIAESNETNNAYAYSAPVIRNGYMGMRWGDGSDITTSKVYDIRGDTLTSFGDSQYIGVDTTGTTVTWTAGNLPIPAGATVKDAHLYVPYTWDINNWYAPDNVIMTFNGDVRTTDAFYYDQKNWGAWSNYDFGVMIYNVTDQFSTSGNTANLKATGVGPNYAYLPIRGMNLVVTYEDTNATEKQIFINDGFDLLYAQGSYFTTPETATAYAPFTGAEINLSRVESATLTTSVTRGSAKGTMLFNGNSWTNYWVPGQGEIGLNTTDITPYLTSTDNTVMFRNEIEGYSIEAYLAILKIEYQGDATAPVAGFSANMTSGTAPLTVQFTDTSTISPTSWAWDFDNDGAIDSTDQNPEYTYTSEGTYSVNLTVSNTEGTDSELKAGYITVTGSGGGLAPVAVFGADLTTGTAPLAVQFTDVSENTPTSWLWDFGDGDATNATEQNPVHTYTAAGSYTVNLTATNANGSNSNEITDFITVTGSGSGDAPVAAFSADADSGRVPFTVTFTDTSTGAPTGWAWNFGDGSTSTGQNPTHTYVTAGSYTVTLTATNAGGSNTATAASPLVVSAPLTSPSYNGGIPLTTAQSGTVSGGLWYDAYPGFATSASKTFTLPGYTDIKWARLYTVVYLGHMQNNYRGTVTINIDGNNDGTNDLVKQETFNSTYSFPGEGGTGPVWLNDHLNRVTSDYLMWYNVTDIITGQQVKVQATAADIDASFDGRIKTMVLAVAYDDGDADQVYYWVNQGHDTVNANDETTGYTGSTAFSTASLPGGWDSANLSSIYLASTNGAYTFRGNSLSSGTPTGSYFGSDTWDVGSLLTSGQDSTLTYTRAADYYKTPLAFLSVRYAATPSAPVADFSVNATSGTAPLAVKFTDTSTNSPTSWAWDFNNDETVDSTEQNPEFTYSSEGTYTVNLTVTNAGGSDSETRSGYITVTGSGGGLAPVVLFSADPTSGNAPLTVQFTDISENSPSAWLWDFGDGDSTNETVQNPVHTYASAGTYSVNLTATNAYGSSSNRYADWITVAPAPSAPVAAFSANVTTGTAPVTVKFTDTSTNSPTAWNWDFDNDGTVDSTVQNPEYTFNSAGTYSINLSVTNAGGSDSELKTDYITVTGSGSGNAPVAAFSTAVTNGVAPVSATFTDASTNAPTTWNWESRIADNGTWTSFSTDQNPVHSFTTPGTYDIRLTATNAAGSDTLTRTHAVAVANAGEPLTAVRSGTVSGDLFVESPSTYATGVTEVTHTFSLPADAVGNIQWARLYVNTYSGTAAGEYGLTSTVQLDGNTLGIETMDIKSTTTGASFPLNDHVTKVYSDYEAQYDVTSLIASANPVVHVRGDAISGLTFDGRIKGITLVAAYNDGDSDQVQYWVQHGQHYVTSGNTNSTSFDTSAIPTGWTSANASIRYHSSSDASYTFNGVPVASSTPPNTGGALNSWNVTDDLTVGTNTLEFTKSTSYSYKATIATLAVKYTTGGTPSAPVSSFSANVTTGIAPLVVRFTDTSTNSPTSWAWDFNNDGTVDSTIQNPVHTYSTAGTYSVNLTVTNAAGFDSELKTGYIAVTSTTTAPVAAFTANKTAGDVPLSVKFTDASTNTPTAWTWDFDNDGTVDSTLQNPVHTYSTAGTYTVKLTAENTAGSNSVTKTGYISANEVTVVANNFTISCVQTTNGGGTQHVSIDTTLATVTTTGNTVNMTNVGSGWDHLEILMTDTPENGGTTINGTVSTVKAVTDPVTAPITSVGTPVVQIELALNEIPGTTAAITQTITKDPDATAQSAFVLAASSSGKQIDEIAYTLNVAKTNLANCCDGGIIKNATILMTVSPAWVAAHGGTDHIVIMRRADDGSTQFLTTQFLGSDSGSNYVFSALSPNGLSTFAMASVSSVTSSSPSSSSSVSSGSDSSDSGRSSSTAATVSGVQAGQTATFTFAQPISADIPVGIRTVSIVPTQSLGETDVIVQDSEVGNLAETLGRPVAGVEKIVPVGISSSAIDHATITFAVSSTWLSAHNIAPSDVVLVHNTNGQWIDLPTTFNEQSGTTCSFSATTPGFSLFAVSVKQSAVTSSVTAVPTTSATIASTTQSLQAEAVTTIPTTVKPVAVQTTAAPAPVLGPSSAFPEPYLLVAVAGTVVIIMGVVIGKRWWVRRQNPDLFRDYK